MLKVVLILFLESEFIMVDYIFYIVGGCLIVLSFLFFIFNRKKESLILFIGTLFLCFTYLFGEFVFIFLS